VPTHEEAPRFWRDWNDLTGAQQRQFDVARRKFVACLRQRPPRFNPELRVKRVQGRPDVWELSWAPDGRATFIYGTSMNPGEPHIIWRRIGTHSIFREP
jgi:hypothetical protein